jgi:hypothetical protein
MSPTANAPYDVAVEVFTRGLMSGVGQVQAQGLWRESRPSFVRWTTARPPRSSWQPTPRPQGKFPSR